MLARASLLLLSGLWACGGRATFDSDPDSTDPSRPLGNGGSSNGPGTPAKTGTAGAPSPIPGGGEAANTIGAACSKYCTAQAQQVCGLDADDQCTPSCSAELGRQTLVCQKQATLMIDCLVAAYRNSDDCSTAEQFARDQCAMWIRSYQGCAAGQPDPPPPAEPPPPTPIPTTPPMPPIPMGCSGTGTANGFSCSMSMKCGARSYEDIHCKQNPDGSSSCECGRTFVIVNARVDTACREGIANCAR